LFGENATIIDLCNLEVAARQPGHQPIDEEAHVRADNRVCVVAQECHQILGELHLHAHIRLGHLLDEAIQIAGLAVGHRSGCLSVLLAAATEINQAVVLVLLQYLPN